MTFEDLRILCFGYGLSEPLGGSRYPKEYYIYGPFPKYRYLGSFGCEELEHANPGDVEARVAEWSLEAAFEMC
jgi:hypothetical protein